MSALSEGLADSAPCHPFEHEGRTYQVRGVTQAVKVDIEKRLLATARQVLQMEREDGLLTDDGYARQRQLLNEDFQAGEFAFDSERGQRYLKNPLGGGKHLTALLFQTDEADIMRLLAARGEEVVALVKTVLFESFPIPPEKRAEVEKKVQAELAALKDKPTPEREPRRF